MELKIALNVLSQSIGIFIVLFSHKVTPITMDISIYVFRDKCYIKFYIRRMYASGRAAPHS